MWLVWRCNSNWLLLRGHLPIDTASRFSTLSSTLNLPTRFCQSWPPQNWDTSQTQPQGTVGIFLSCFYSPLSVFITIYLQDVQILCVCFFGIATRVKPFYTRTLKKTNYISTLPQQIRKHHDFSDITSCVFRITMADTRVTLSSSQSFVSLARQRLPTHQFARAACQFSKAPVPAWVAMIALLFQGWMVVDRALTDKVLVLLYW